MKNTIFLFAGLTFLTIKNQAQTVTDYEGNLYDTVTIGTQVWLKENLKVTKYNDGTAIPLVTDSAEWSNLTTPGYCWYNNDEAAYKNSYGALYNWFTINSDKLCPSGWHVPSDAEWTQLTIYLGGDSLAGGKLKEIGTTHWNSPNVGATNETGFTAIAGGYRHGSGFFDNLGHDGYWWGSSEHNTANYWQRSIPCYNGYIIREYFGNNYGLSVRCIMNSTTQIHEINNQVKIKIYPNPATDKIYIINTENLNFNIHIYNCAGECVLKSELNSLVNMVDISSLMNGIYIIKLTGVNIMIKQKLIKN